MMDGFERVPGHSGNYALRLFGQNLATNAVIGDGFFGGAPWNTRPDSIVGYARYDILPGDSAGMMVLFKKNGQIFDTAFLLLPSGVQNTFQRIARKINYTTSLIPDSIVVIFVPTNYLNGPDTHFHNSITLDDVSFLPGNVGFPNSNFEDWFTSIVDQPLYWGSFGFIELDTLDPTAGHMVSKVYFNAPSDFAAQITSIYFPIANVAGGEISTRTHIFNENPADFPVRGRHVTLNGYYQFFPAATGDTMEILLTMYKNSTAIGYADFFSADSVTSFSPFNIPINYIDPTEIPDSASLRIKSSKGNGKAGTKLMVDKLSFDGFVSAVNNTHPDLFELDGMKVFPNPARDRLIVENLLADNKECSLSLFSVKGEIIKEIKLAATEHSAQIEVGELSPGFYLLVMKKGERTFSKKIIIQR